MIIFKMNENGKVKLCDFGITDGERVEACETEAKAKNLLENSRYADFTVINSDKPSEKLLEILKGVRFDSIDDAEAFINGGGFKESVLSRVEDLENVMAEVIGGTDNE